MAARGGTLRFADLEALPRHSAVYLLQCGAPTPTGIAKWTGVRFRDFANLIGLLPNAHYGRFVATDRYYVDEEVRTLLHPQVMLAWLMNDAPIPPEHGAPLRLIVPFRHGARWLKAITEITFGTPGLPTQPLPA
jgi:DMSO/TMAO reductase YedYZ molybdopterin-dependent catalytic subunit